MNCSLNIKGIFNHYSIKNRAGSPWHSLQSWFSALQWCLRPRTMHDWWVILQLPRWEAASWRNRTHLHMKSECGLKFTRKCGILWESVIEEDLLTYVDERVDNVSDEKVIWFWEEITHSPLQWVLSTPCGSQCLGLRDSEHLGWPVPLRKGGLFVFFNFDLNWFSTQLLVNFKYAWNNLGMWTGFFKCKFYEI